MIIRTVVGYIKFLLTLVGSRLSKHVLQQIQASLNYLRIGRWMRDHKFSFTSRVRSREHVWDTVLDRISTRKVLYLEFGVANGDSIRYWAKGLQHPETMLHGFDSFEGMPEEGGPWSKGQFDAHGRTPEIADSRVAFIKGWFDQSLPHYKLPAHELLVLNMDADLYSSTSFVLNYLAPHIKPGTFIYFDEMNHIDHEPRAFAELVSRHALKFRPVSADRTLAHVCFECVA
jgi:hypothetical protein